MGLDMLVVSSKSPINSMEYPLPNGAKIISSWRNHYPLHLLMWRLVNEDCSEATVSVSYDFLQLNKSNLLKLKIDIENGVVDYDDTFHGNTRDKDLFFIKRALNDIRKGRHIYYSGQY